MKYCTRCVMPDTKPDLRLDVNGVCNACRSYESRDAKDYEKRQLELTTIIEKYCPRDGSNWDCVIPVSGGKDSTYQVIKALELGLRPLAVTSSTCHESELGAKNIKNLKNLGVDHIQLSPDITVRRKLNGIALREVGDISWPEHVGIFTIPVSIAVKFGIKMIIWGENSQHEYGGPAAAAENNILDRRWLEEFGGLLGLRVSDIPFIDESITKKDLIPYNYPSDEELKRAGVTGLFLGYYFPWDGLANTLISTAHGFHSHETRVEGSLVNYENLDNWQTGIHDYFKFLKFGFGRASDLACVHIRRGRISRAQALEMMKLYDGKFPLTYLGKPLKEILDPLDMTVDEFVTICDKFTNKSIFKTDSQGNLVKQKDGSLIKLNYDNT